MGSWDLGVGSEGQDDTRVGSSCCLVWEGRQDHGPVSEHRHPALRGVVGRGLVVVAVVMMVMLVLMQVSVLVLVV